MNHQVLTTASRQLFTRAPDEVFDSLDALAARCRQDRENSTDRWLPPQELEPCVDDDRLLLRCNGDGAFRLNDWSFTQMCNLAGISKDTINRLSPPTARQALLETLPSNGSKPLQLFTREQTIRSLHGATYTRLYNTDLIDLIAEVATDFQPPQRAIGGGTGLYCGEQDMFCFLIDPLGWAEIEGEAFAPGFFLWNSEVGRRTVGIQTFWFQAVCANHIVWDAVEVVNFSRKHTARVRDALDPLRMAIEDLAAKRDARRDGFARVIHKAMETTLGRDAEEAAKALATRGIPRNLAKEALAIAEKQGRFTIFALVDALTRASAQLRYAGDRMEADQKASALLGMAG